MTALQRRILDAALPNVAFDGWSERVLVQAAGSLGLSTFDVKRAFPGGVGDAIDAFAAQADEAMLAALRADYKLSEMKIRARIHTAVMVRLRQQQANREAIRRAIGHFTMPWNAPAGLSILYRTVDVIWREAGDTSTDYNFYTKRAMLAGVYQSTVNVWLDDTSENLQETEAFLARRIENVMQIEKAKAKLRDASWLPEFLRKQA